MSLLLLFSFLCFRPQCLYLSLCLCLSLVFSLAPSLHLPPHLSFQTPASLFSLGFFSHYLGDSLFPEPSLSLPDSLSISAPSLPGSVSISPGVSFPFLQKPPQLAWPWPTGSLVAARPLLVSTKLLWQVSWSTCPRSLHPGVCLLPSPLESLLRPESRPVAWRKDASPAAGPWEPQRKQSCLSPRVGASSPITISSPT